MTLELQRFVNFVGTFQPTRTDNLKDGAAEWIGRRCMWQPVWTIEDGPYVGQWACQVIDESSGFPRAPFVWVPQEDLQDLAPIPTMKARLPMTAVRERSEFETWAKAELRRAGLFDEDSDCGGAGSVTPFDNATYSNRRG